MHARGARAAVPFLSGYLRAGWRARYILKGELGGVHKLCLPKVVGLVQGKSEGITPTNKHHVSGSQARVSLATHFNYARLLN